MASLVDASIFIAASAGTGDFVVSAARPGWRTPAQAAAVNGATYRYRAYSDSQLEWEIGTGVYDSGTTTLTRAVILDSSNAGAAVNFTTAPNVALTVFADDYATEGQLAKIDFVTVTGAVDLDVIAAAIASYGTAATKNVGTAAGNVPELDGSGLLDTSILPALAISDVFVVASQAAMLALTAQRGDIAVRTDLNKSFVLSTNSPGTLADWKELLTPTDTVLSVAGLTGAISDAALKAALDLVESVTGADSVDVDNTDPVNPVVALVNDSAAPGNNKVYGTDGSGVRGWKADPTSGIGGSTGSTDNRLLRADGTGGATVQASSITVDDSGNITSFGGQLGFPATQNPSSDANTLDDYEEGTYTPSYNGTVGNGTLSGSYTKIGRVVVARFHLTFGSTTTANAGGITAGIPFACDVTYTCLAYAFDSGTAHRLGIARITAAGGSGVQFSSDNSGSIWVNNVPFTWATNDQLQFTMVYTV